MTSSSSSNDRWLLPLEESEIQHLGKSLRQIDPAFMKAETSDKRQRIWYQGDEPYFDIVLELEQGQIQWFQFTLRGKVLSWNRDPLRLQTGETDELDVPAMVSYYAASKTIRDGAPLDRPFLALVKAILQTRPEEDWLKAMAETLAHG